MAIQKLTNNQLSVIALANEYCQSLELVASVTPEEFVGNMIRLLPRIYISVSDMKPRQIEEEPDYSMDAVHLDEIYYDQIREDIASLLGEFDSYLETFHPDMQYSDTPIAATISEGLADIFQVLYNFVEDIKVSDTEEQLLYLANLREDFASFWSQTLCNVMRPLNELSHKDWSDEEDF